MLLLGWICLFVLTVHACVCTRVIFRFSTYKIMPSVSRANCTSFPIWTLSISFSCLIALAGTLVEQKKWKRPPCLFPHKPTEQVSILQSASKAVFILQISAIQLQTHLATVPGGGRLERQSGSPRTRLPWRLGVIKSWRGVNGISALRGEEGGS
jgi:hypothetical protein